jgi:hypothetical protein
MLAMRGYPRPRTGGPIGLLRFARWSMPIDSLCYPWSRSAGRRLTRTGAAIDADRPICCDAFTDH